MAPKRKAAAAAAEKQTETKEKKPARKRTKAGGDGVASGGDGKEYPVKRESGVSVLCSSGRLCVIDPDQKYTDVLRGLQGRSFLGSEPFLNTAASGEWAIRRLRLNTSKNGDRTSAIMFVHSKIAALPKSSYLQFRATRDWSDGDAFSDAKARKSLESMFSADERAKLIHTGSTAAIPNWDPNTDCRNELFVAIRVLTSELGSNAGISAVHLPVLNLIGQYLIATNPVSTAGDDTAMMADVDMTDAAAEPKVTKGRGKGKKSAASASAGAAAVAAAAAIPAGAGEGGYFQLRAKPASSACPVSKWISVGRVNTDSCSLGLFDIPDSLNEWVIRSDEITAFKAQPPVNAAAAELKVRAEFMARLISINAGVQLGLGHNYGNWLPVDAAAASAGTSGGSSGGGAIPVSSIVSEKLKNLAHGAWSDSGPGDGEYEVFVKYADVPVGSGGGLFVPVVIGIYILFDEGTAKAARRAQPPDEDENAPPIPAVPVRPKPPAGAAAATDGSGSSGGAASAASSGSGGGAASSFLAKRAEAKAAGLAAAFTKVESDPLTATTPNVIKIEFTTLMGAAIGAGPLLARESDTLDEIRARFYKQYLNDTGLRHEVVGFITRRGGGGGVPNQSGPAGLKNGETCTVVWSFDRTQDIRTQQGLVAAATQHMR